MKTQRQVKTTQQTAIRIVAVGIAALCIMFAPQANACSNPTKAAGLNGLRTLTPMLAFGTPRLAPHTDAAVAGNEAGDNDSPSIVGMWEVSFHAGGALYDHAYQQFFADGNELQNSGLFPPEAGNVCFGTWKTQNARTFKLKHFGWLFDKGELIGTLILTATMRVGTPAGRNTYFGTFVADVLLPSGKIDPSQHAEGTVQATRLTVD